MIYFLTDRDDCRIGHAVDAGKRIKQHLSSHPRWQIHAIIEGDLNHEREMHEFFSGQRIELEGTASHYRIEGKLADYLDYMADKAWAASTIAEVPLIYPHPSRFPWAAALDEVGDWQPTLAEMPSRIRQPLSRSSKILATIRSDSDEWHTPTIYVEAARRVMGRIDLDPASNPLANQTVRAASILTRDDDGLRYHWRGNVWLNPPYGGTQAAFVRHLLAEHESGRVEQAIACLNSHATDTDWFQSMWGHPICFTHHRPKFVGGTHGKSESEVSPTTGIAFVYVGANRDAFTREFSAFGPVVTSVEPASIDSRRFKREMLPHSWDAA